LTLPVPLERYYHSAEALAVLASARKLALLHVLDLRGPMSLARAVYEAGMPTHGALRDANELEALGLVTVERPTGRNLSERLTLRQHGLGVLALADLWAD
jgi:predicted transcriptional regulator